MLSSSLHALFAAQLVYSGTLGQVRAPEEDPVPWTDCAWCAVDAAGKVHFPGGWCVCAGRLEREACDVSGTVFSDGEGTLFSFHPQRAELGRVMVEADGLHQRGTIARLPDGKWKVLAAARSRPRGYAARARFLALDCNRRVVRGWTDDGMELGVLFSFVDRTEPFVSLALHSASGDLLLGTAWPENAICRFRPDGTEVKDAFWPAKGYALELATSGDETWVLGWDAARLVESKAPSARCSFGQFANAVHALAVTTEGYWLATSQGAQFYRRNDLSRCAWRVGGLSDVGALALHDGRVLAGAGYRMLNLWLDDGPGDVLSSDVNWKVARRYDEKIDLIEVRDDVFYLHDATSGNVTAFDPRVTEWVFRARRQHAETNFLFKAKVDRVRFGRRRDFVAVAASDGIRLYRHESMGRNRLLQTVPAKATALAGEGEWLVAYEPDRRAVVRYRLVEENVQLTNKRRTR